MSKTLKDIIVPRAGRNVPKGEEDFLDLHKVDEKDYPVKQKKDSDTHKASTKQKSDSKHGYMKPKESEKAYKNANEEFDVIDELSHKKDENDRKMNKKRALEKFLSQKNFIRRASSPGISTPSTSVDNGRI